MSQFPIIRFPVAIQQALNAKPPIPDRPKLFIPQYPDNPPKKPNIIILIIIETALYVILSYLIARFFDNNLVNILLLVGGIGAIVFQIWKQSNNYLQKKKQHQRQIAIYDRQLKEYEQQMYLYYKRVQVAQSPEKIAKFRDNLLLKVLSKTIPHNGNNRLNKKGCSEDYFCFYLKTYFPNNIYTRLTLNIPNFLYPYSPDFA